MTSKAECILEQCATTDVAVRLASRSALRNLTQSAWTKVMRKEDEGLVGDDNKFSAMFA